jgi:plasmid stabilization system protein ParE
VGFKVILTPQSIVDLEEIISFIASDNPNRAGTFGHELIDRALSVTELPERGRVVPEIGDAAVREIVHGNYRIIYEIFSAGGYIYVLRFWHGARGTPNIKSTR